MAVHAPVPTVRLELVVRHRPLDMVLAPGSAERRPGTHGDPHQNDARRDNDQEDADHRGSGLRQLRALASGCPGVLAFATMSRNTALQTVPLPDALAGRSIVLVGLMGAGKTSIGRRLAARLGLPFRDADAEIELAAGCTIPEIFARYGEREFRDGERSVIRRLLAGRPHGAGIRRRRLHGPGHPRRGPRRGGFGLAALRRCRHWSAGSPAVTTGPCWPVGDPAEILDRLIDQRYPFYAEADVIVDCGDEPPEITTSRVLDAVLDWRAPAPAAGGALQRAL